MEQTYFRNLAAAQGTAQDLYRLLSIPTLGEGKGFELPLAQLMQAIGLTMMVHEALLAAASARMGIPP